MVVIGWYSHLQRHLYGAIPGISNRTITSGGVAINKYDGLRSRLGILNIKHADLTTNDQQKRAEIWIQHDTTRKINGCVLGRSTASLNSWIMLNLYFWCLMLNHEVVRCPRRSQEGVQLPKGVEEEQSRDLAVFGCIWVKQLNKHSK